MTQSDVQWVSGPVIVYRRWRLEPRHTEEHKRAVREARRAGTLEGPIWSFERRLYSLHGGDDPWVPGEDVRARCRVKNRRGPHDVVPEPRCKCGIYGTWDIGDAIMHYRVRQRPQALGAVELSAHILPVEKGARGELARVTVFYDFSPWDLRTRSLGIEWAERYQEYMRRVAAAYVVPFLEVPDVERYLPKEKPRQSLKGRLRTSKRFPREATGKGR